MWALHKLHQQKRRREDESHGIHSSDPIVLDDDSLDENIGRSGWAQPDAEVTKPAKVPDEKVEPDQPWEFSYEDLARFPALKKRNFWCIQRHQARALHYDLRMQLDGATVSWAIPRGLLGMSKKGDKNRLAVQTTLHPISYTVYEGGDGRILPSGERCGTLLWDVGTYSIHYPWNPTEDDSDSENERRRKRRRGKPQPDQDSDDPTGKYEEDKFRMAFERPVRAGKAKSIHFTLKGGRKLKNNHYILVLAANNAFAPAYGSTGQRKITWFVALPRGVEEYSWGAGGEEGERYGRSVKTGRTLKQVCGEARVRLVTWKSEKERFEGWGEDEDEVGKAAEA